MLQLSAQISVGNVVANIRSDPAYVRLPFVSNLGMVCYTP